MAVLGRLVCTAYYLTFEIALEIWKGNVKVFSDNLNGFYSLFLEIRVPWAVWVFCPYSINHLFLKAEGIQFPRCVLIPRVVPTLLLPFLGKGKILMWKMRGKNSSPRWRVIVPFWLWSAWGIEKVGVASFAQVSRKSWALALDWSYLCAVLWTREPQERSEFCFILFYFIILLLQLSRLWHKVLLLPNEWAGCFETPADDALRVICVLSSQFLISPLEWGPVCFMLPSQITDSQLDIRDRLCMSHFMP